MIVVDASALVEALVGGGQTADRLASDDLAAPHLVDAECGNVLLRMARRGLLNHRLAEHGLGVLRRLEILRYPHVELLPRAWELRDSLTIYDGLYVALAEHLDVPLVTLDAAFGSAPGVRATVEVAPARR
ncbi:MAG: type II toxin-antitoxin system VapC family toxin [Nocardioidaceae bacterium]|nr:type II toxin-antitoxin system VapC family toxin [Nocardioidaceae bacterium]